MQRLLVTGASGFLGWHVCQRAARRWHVIGIAGTHLLEIPGVSLERVDLAESDAVTLLLERVRPDAVLHLAAMSKPDQCQQHPEQSWQVNVEASRQIAAWCARQQIPCVFTSTDLVFDGRRGSYRETDAVGPVSVYGQHKVLAEEEMRRVYPAVTICRMPLMYGLPAPHAHSFLSSLVSGARRGQALRLFVDEFRSPLNAVAAADGLLLALEKQPPLLHLGGRDRVSRFEMGRIVLNALEADPTLLVPTRQADLVMAAPRPADVSLDSTLARSLGFEAPPLDEDLATVARDLPPVIR